MRHLSLLLVVFALLLPSRTAVAAEPTFAELVAAYEEADKAQQSEEQARLLGLIAQRAAQAQAAPDDKEAQKAVEADRKTARQVLRRALEDRYRVVILAALEGYGTLALPGSAVDLRRFANRQASEHRPQAVRLAAIAAWGRIHDPGTHPLLLDYVRLPRPEAEAVELALAALSALADFRDVPRGVHRYELLDGTMSRFLTLRDEAAGIGGVSVVATEWYASLRAGMLAAWSRLTGETTPSLTAAQRWWNDHKRAVLLGNL